MTESDRSTTITWADPGEVAGHARSMAGLDFLRALIAGEVPQAPIQDLLGFTLERVDEGRAVFAAIPGERHYNPIGVVHAGLAATMLDSAMGVAVHSTLPQGRGYTTLETKFNLVRPITGDTGRIEAEGTVIHRGRQVATAEGRVTDPAGKLLAHGTSTCLIIGGP